MSERRRDFLIIFAGAVAGAVIGAPIGYAEHVKNNERQGGTGELTRKETILALTDGGAALGLVGGAIGLLCVAPPDIDS